MKMNRVEWQSRNRKIAEA